MVLGVFLESGGLVLTYFYAQANSSIHIQILMATATEGWKFRKFEFWLWWKRSLLEGFLGSVSFWTHTCVTPILYAFFSSVVGPSLAYISGVCFLLYKFYFSHVLTLFALVVRSYLNILQVQINLLPVCFLWFLMVLRISVRQHILSGLTISIQLVQQTCHSSLPWPSEYHFQILLVHRPESYE